MVGAVAEFERELILKRSRAGTSAARARWPVTGCRRGWISPDAGTGRAADRDLPHPEVARPLLRAALLNHPDRGLPVDALFTRREAGLLLAQAMGYRSVEQLVHHLMLLERRLL